MTSIITKYGDRDNVPKDCKALYDIIKRQGASLLIDCIAEHVGQANLNHHFNTIEKQRIVEMTIDELNEAMWERL